MTGCRALLAKASRLSLRTRLLAGLLAVIVVFLVVLGAVASAVLWRIEQNQFDGSLQVAGRQSVMELATSAQGYSAAYLALDEPYKGQVGAITAPSPASAELQAMLAGLAGQQRDAIMAELQQHASHDVPFGLQLPGRPPLRATWREVPLSAAGPSPYLPDSDCIVVVGMPVSEIGDQVHDLIIAMIATGAVMLALLAISGNWLIARGLGPLGKMAATADMIAARGDLTERMPVPEGSDHQEAGKLAAAINMMLARIEQAFAARLRSEAKVRQFAADASHEMRTPLTTIRGYAELYRQGAIGARELPAAMRRIEQEADRMSRLVAELLELARLDRDSSLDLTETDLTELVRDAVADARAVEPGRRVTAQVPDAPVIVTVDEPRLRQVLANLLANVRAHTPPAVPATVTLAADDDGVTLQVGDLGPGMSQADAARAFDRFHRGTGARLSPEPGGSGLGLSIVEAIATAHGGHTRLESAPGQGTTVRIWIPAKARPLDPEPAAPDHAPLPRRNQAALSGKAALPGG